MTMPPLLSICIPTYNRASFLRDTLERIGRQMPADLAASVEIVVSDNASTDGTPAVLSEMAAAYPHVCLRPHRQPQNRGPDANIYETVKRASGEFCYILSDDDVLLPGAVARLLGLMGEHPEADALTLNIRSFTRDLEEPEERWFPVAGDTFYGDRDEALRALALSHLFLSMTAFRRALVTKDYTDKIGTNLLQSYLFLDVLACGRGLVISARPYLAQRLVNTGGYGFFKVMVTNYEDLMRYAEALGFAPATVRGFREKQLRTSVFHFLLRYKRMRDGYDFRLSAWDGIRRLLQAHGPDPFLLTRVIPLLLVPAPLLRGGWRLYRRVKHGAMRGGNRGPGAPPLAGVDGGGP